MGLLGLGAVACGGDDDGARAAAGAGDDSGFWLATDLPATYQPIRSEVRDGIRLIAYAAADFDNDSFDAPLSVILAEEDETPDPGSGEPIEVQDRRGRLSVLQSDGVEYGVAITWEVDGGRWLRVEGSEPLTREDVEIVANGLAPVSQEEWERVALAVSMDTRVGRVDPDPDEIEITSGEIDGEPWAFVALVPGGYPLADYDRRLTCYRVDFRGESGKPRCESHPWRERVGGQLFVFGSVQDSTEMVQVSRFADGVQPVTDHATVAIDRGMPRRFYVLPVPDGTCYAQVLADPPDPSLAAPAGPVVGDPDLESCLASVPR